MTLSLAAGFPLLGSAQTLPLESVLNPIEVKAEDEARSREFLKPIRPQRIGKQRIEDRQATDVSRVLRETSGTYIRDEDGQGLRPNIGLRGTNPDRSRKVVFLEDGILIGPAPYAAPAAYYVPSTNLIEDMAVAKGYQAVSFGPNSVGGAVLFRTAPVVQSSNQSEIRSSLGSFGTLNTRLTTTGSIGLGSDANTGSEGSTRSLGYLLQVSNWGSEGFKRVDGGGRAGFIKNDILAKLKFSDVWFGRPQSTELRLGFSDEVSDETYLGLEANDFAADFRRRYVASQNDRMSWQHRKLQLQHVAILGEKSVVEVNLYSHWFDRTWYRFDGFRDGSVTARSVLAPGGNELYRNVLRGVVNSTDVGIGAQLNIVNNQRSYLSQGLQAQYNTEWDWSQEGSVRSDFQAFARLHSDWIERNHTADYWDVVDGQTVRTAAPRRTDVVNRDSATATTVSAVHDLKVDQWVFSQIARFENVDFQFENRLDASRSTARTDRTLVGGLSLMRQFGENISLRASVNNATTMAGLSATGQEVKEEALNSELEFRARSPSTGLDFELTGFRTDYRNITGTCTVSSGCSSQNLDVFFNGGQAAIEGAELGLALSPRIGAVALPVRVAATRLRAAFQNEFTSSSPDWGVGSVRSGDPLPYVPHFIYTASVGTETRLFRQDLVFVYSSEVADQSVAEGRVNIPAYGIIDWAGVLRLTDSIRLLGRIDNLLAREYAVAARPFGLRPGRPQAFSVALQASF